MQMLFQFQYSYRDSPTYYWIVGVLLAALASLVSNVGLNLQKLLHMRNMDMPEKERRLYFKYGLWWLGLGLVIMGSLADLAALFFAPQAVIAPLGSLTLVSNTIFAPILLKEQVGMREIFGTLLIVVGAVVAVSFGPHKDIVYDTKTLFVSFIHPFFIAYSVLVTAIMLSLYISIKKCECLEKSEPHGPVYTKWRSFHRFAYPAISGVVGACSVLFCKCFVELMHNSAHGDNMFRYYQSYFVVVSMFGCIFLQIYFLNNGLRRFDSAYTVPVFQCFWIVFSVFSGLVFFHEYHDMSWGSMGMFSVGVIIAVVGIAILSQRKIAPLSRLSGFASKAPDTEKNSDKEEDDLEVQNEDAEKTPLNRA